MKKETDYQYQDDVDYYDKLRVLSLGKILKEFN